MALRATRGAASGKLGRLRSLCNLLLEAKSAGKATGKAWWQAGVIKRNDHACEEFVQSVIDNCVAWGVIVGMHTSEEATRQASDRGEWAAVINPPAAAPETLCRIPAK